MKYRSNLAVLAALLLLGVAACELIQAYDINGSWEMNIILGDDRYKFTITFSGTKTAGSCSFTYDGNNYAGLYTVESKRVVTIQFSGEEAALNLNLDGVFDNSDSMSGTWTSDLTNDTGTWSATRD